ncbi:MAG: hypothetical protein JXO49_00040 [Deltaproteobacteria bacterium]|nr:hypothetical protein [Candidatus Anaeroferrophillus wilburensis]MBN2887713.1 hypothetical protein [Deltaproteobacteria bacterium]
MSLSPTISLISRQATCQESPPLQAMITELQQRYGKAIEAVLFYGSCRRSGDYFDGLLDLYLLVDDYHNAYDRYHLALLNRLLPPNVFYLEIAHNGRTVRGKYAVLSIDDFERGTSPRWFHSYLWGRFAQPTGILYARTDQIQKRLHHALAEAARTFVSRVIPCLPDQFTARELWCHGFSLTYRAELRTERQHYRDQLFQQDANYYEHLTATLLTADGTDPAHHYRNKNSPGRRRLCRWGWTLRIIQGKLLSVLRLLKALTTFNGGVQYIFWKIERHSGIRPEADTQGRQKSLFALCRTFWQIYRQGGFR